MSKETLISEPIVASIVVDRSGPNRLHRSMGSEFALIGRGLFTICDPDRDHLFIIFGRAHKVVPTRPAEFLEGHAMEAHARRWRGSTDCSCARR